MTGHTVLVVGGGPTGMTLAAELALADIDVAIVERRPSPQLAGSRAGGLHARTIEVLDQRGVAERFLSQGQVMQVAGLSAIPLDISDFPTRHNYGLALRQERIEEILAGWVAELGVPIHRGREVTGFTQDDAGVRLELAGGDTMAAEYLVGCDGGRSLIRKTAGIAFPGWDPSVSYLIAEVQMSDEPELGMQRDEKGIHALGPLGDGRIRAVVREEDLGRRGEPTLGDLSETLIAVRGTDYGVHSPTWISRFTDATRQAESYRSGRVLLAGDASHVHSPMGGQGLNLGVQDAVNLGWKLAQVAHGSSPESLLDTYHAERHPVGAQVLQLTMAGTALSRADVRTEALRAVVSEMLGLDQPRRRLAGAMSGLDTRYDLGDGHPLLGRRMPDLDLVAADGRTVRMFTLLHEARPVLVNLGARGLIEPGPWAGRVRLVDAGYAGSWELPVIGEIDAPTAVLVRPDGYVAWVGERTDAGLSESLTTWFGPAPDGPTG